MPVAPFALSHYEQVPWDRRLTALFPFYTARIDYLPDYCIHSPTPAHTTNLFVGLDVLPFHHADADAFGDLDLTLCPSLTGAMPLPQDGLVPVNADRIPTGAGVPGWYSSLRA